MDAAEVAGHLRRRYRHSGSDRAARRLLAASAIEARSFPALPDSSPPDRVTRAALADLDRLLGGRWRAFHHLEWTLDDPPRWQKDHLAGIDLTRELPGHKLDPRRPQRGADARMIWELNRWDPLVQAAQAAWLLRRDDAAALCLRWLEDWARTNRPYRGWNWTSALESGIRLIALAWIDALLGAASRDAEASDRLSRVVAEVLPAHAWFTWQQRSFGSSANNHLLGELAGLIVASARWPGIARASAPIEVLERMWEVEVLAQFAEDGGNREQALHYHLFALELCWQAARALEALDRPVAREVLDRLGRAAAFYAAVQVEQDPWDYGDSDDAFVTRFHTADDPRGEWRRWMLGDPGGEAIEFWIGRAPRVAPSSHHGTDHARGAWTTFPRSGIAVFAADGWFARLDASPLGYLSTAAHGHLDALHLSLWLDGVAIVVDPGTGAYYAQPRLRELLASRGAHNGPCPIELDRPRRLGAFLWSEHHPIPTIAEGAGGSLEASLRTPMGTVHRRVRFDADGSAWTIDDSADGGADFSVRWQLAPGSIVESAGERAWRVTRRNACVLVAARGPWSEATIGNSPVSPSFRVVVEAPCISLRAGGAAAGGRLQTRIGRAP
jgi:hypothetical protein